MKYISAKDASIKWNISIRQVQLLCSMDKVPGATLIDRRWYIPSTSDKPLDSRTKEGMAAKEKERYIFPILCETQYYSEKNFLIDDDKELLRIEKEHLEGKYLQCISDAKDLLVSSRLQYIKVGSLASIAYAAMTAGLLNEYKIAMSEINKIATATNNEDYKLIYAALHFLVSWDSSLYDQINVNKLSGSSYFFYQLNSHYISILLNELLPQRYEHNFEILSLTFYQDNLEILNLTSHFLLAIYYFKKSNFIKAKEHTFEACKICEEKEWTRFIATYYSILKTYVNSYFENKKELLDYIANTAEKNNKNINIISKSEKNKNPFIDIDLENLDIIYLYYQRIKKQTIAKVKNCSTKEITKSILEQMKKLNIKSEEKFIEYLDFNSKKVI